MNHYLLDTDWVVDILNGQEKAIHTAVELASSGLAISIISYGELYEGAAFARDPQPALAGLRSFLKGKAILPLTQPIMERFAPDLGQPAPAYQAANRGSGYPHCRNVS
jgi:predicted nucleic acid-binding protein